MEAFGQGYHHGTIKFESIHVMIQSISCSGMALIDHNSCSGERTPREIEAETQL